MYAPRPLILQDAVPGNYAPEPVSIEGLGDATEASIEEFLTGLAGYDDGENQTLQNLEGTLTWVTNTP